MKYNVNGFLAIIGEFEKINNGLKEYLNLSINTKLFYKVLGESCFLDNNLIDKIKEHNNLVKQIESGYIANVEKNIGSDKKKAFEKREKSEHGFFKEHIENQGISQEEYYYIYFLIKLIILKEDIIYYFELNSPFGFQGYPLLQSVEVIIKEYSEVFNSSFSYRKISKLYSEKERMSTKFENNKLMEMLNDILENKERYKK